MSLLDADADKTSHQAREARRLTLLAGKLVYGDHQLTLDCSIRDCSDRGARVRLFAAEPLPGRVWFLNLSGGLAYEAQIVWRRYPDVGLAFLEKLDLAGLDTPEGRVIRRLMIEAAPREATTIH